MYHHITKAASRNFDRPTNDQPISQPTDTHEGSKGCGTSNE